LAFDYLGNDCETETVGIAVLMASSRWTVFKTVRYDIVAKPSLDVGVEVVVENFSISAAL
jgi:hypothetical protein